MNKNKTITIKIKKNNSLKEYNPAGRRLNVNSKYKDLINANIKQVLLSSKYKSSKAINKFYAEDIRYLERLLSTHVYAMAKRAKLTLDPSIINQAIQYAIKDAISGKYDKINETDSQDLAIKQKIKKAKEDLAKANKEKADKKAKQAKDKLTKLTNPNDVMQKILEEIKNS